MTYEEAEKLKESLNSNTYVTTGKNILTIYIVPADPEGLKRYKNALQWNWGYLKDKDARAYTLMDNFMLYGIRRLKNEKFSGGPVNLKEHPELILHKKK